MADQAQKRRKLVTSNEKQRAVAKKKKETVFETDGDVDRHEPLDALEQHVEDLDHSWETVPILADMLEGLTSEDHKNGMFCLVPYSCVLRLCLEVQSPSQ